MKFIKDFKQNSRLPPNVRNKLLTVLKDIYKYNEYNDKDLLNFFNRIKDIGPEIIEYQLDKFYSIGTYKGLYYLLKMITNYQDSIDKQLDIERKIYGDHRKVKVFIKGKWKIKEK